MNILAKHVKSKPAMQITSLNQSRQQVSYKVLNNDDTDQS